MPAATFGAVGTLPAEATTGCGLRVPRASVSRYHEFVTCLPRRGHARGGHQRLADRLDHHLPGRPGTTAERDRVGRAVAHHRDPARRFAAP
ncbi:hypothetical protein ACFV2N_32950 [Streptomyces sp. NPDC059680]|uniref:hypothetical protein n=1 Tax=Streptomyces sp. NPDC059680 TaxID=3346904 RepID=UPI0036CDF3F6